MTFYNTGPGPLDRSREESIMPIPRTPAYRGRRVLRLRTVAALRRRRDRYERSRAELDALMAEGASRRMPVVEWVIYGVIIVGVAAFVIASLVSS